MEKRVGKPVPLAFGFAEDDRMYTNFQWSLMEEAGYSNTIGKDLVNFAFVPEDTLHTVLLHLYGDYAYLMEKKPEKETVIDVLLEKYEVWFRRNIYFSVYLMSFLDFLAGGSIDERVYPGTYREERTLCKWAKGGCAGGALELIDRIRAVQESRRAFVEKALRSIYEKPDDGGLTPLEQYYRYEQENPLFRKHLHSTFITKLGTHGRHDPAILPLTVLDTVDDLMRYELLLLLTQGKGYKFCKNCGKPFIPSGRSDTLYCDRVMDGADKPCNEIGAYLAAAKKADENPVLKTYRKAYQRLHKRVELGYMEEEDFAEWRDEATQRRDRCLAGELGAEEFIAWVDGTSRRR